MKYFVQVLSYPNSNGGAKKKKSEENKKIASLLARAKRFSELILYFTSVVILFQTQLANFTPAIIMPSKQRKIAMMGTRSVGKVTL